MTKISFEEFRQKVLAVGISDATIRQYLTVDPQRSGPFAPCFVTDPAKVDISGNELEFATAVCFDSWSTRSLRQTRFEDAIARGDPRPVLVSEGDSWFQHPLRCDIIEHLDNQYLIWSLGRHGDTATNMTGKRAEYMCGLDRWAARVKGFLFSGGGIDLLGEDDSGKPGLLRFLKQYREKRSPAWHIEHASFNTTIELLRTCYSRMITTIRSDTRFTALPIYIHGYDYPFPFPSGYDDHRGSAVSAPDHWLGKPFAQRGFRDDPFRREVLKVMIDALYRLMDELASDHDHVHVVNARNSMPNRECWDDEIHGTDGGFEAVAGRFRAAIAPNTS